MDLQFKQGNYNLQVGRSLGDGPLHLRQTNTGRSIIHLDFTRNQYVEQHAQLICSQLTPTH